MERLKTEVYDPTGGRDPTDFQIQALGDINFEDLQGADLANPTTVQLLIREQLVALSQLKASQNEVKDLRNEISRLRDTREDLRVELARTKNESDSTWIEIPISLFSAFAINRIAANATDVVGLVQLVLCIGMLLGVRRKQITASLKEILGRDREDKPDAN